jgi:hypothetical protein
MAPHGRVLPVEPGVAQRFSIRIAEHAASPASDRLKRLSRPRREIDRTALGVLGISRAHGHAARLLPEIHLRPFQFELFSNSQAGLD